MNRGRLGLAAIAAAGLLATTAVAVAAGGWAVITLDRLPGELAAGETLTIGFTVRQHGRTLLSGLDPAPDIQARNLDTGEIVRAVATDEGSPGHYTTSLRLPSAGSWEWGIRAFGSDAQPMPTIIVVPAAGASGKTEPAADAVLMLGAALLAAFGIGLALRRRLVWSGAAIVLAVLAAGLAFRGGDSAAPAAEAAVADPVRVGAELFLAKGCVACHVNDRIPESADFSMGIGPNLSQYRNDPAFLARWLADPSAVRPATGMPDLSLAEGEIQALIAFLNADRDS